jgi:hypothetical protein
MAYPNYPSSPSYSFTNSYKVCDGYRVLHLPQLIYPTQKTYAPNTIYLNTATCGGSLILGKSTNFVSNPSAVQTVVTASVITVGGSHAKIKGGSNVTGLKLGKGTYDGQHLWLMNEGTTQVNFDTDEATSRIKGGGSLALSSGRFYHFMWNATDSLWYREA